MTTRNAWSRFNIKEKCHVDSLSIQIFFIRVLENNGNQLNCIRNQHGMIPRYQEQTFEKERNSFKYDEASNRIDQHNKYLL